MSAIIPSSTRAIFFDAVGCLLFPEPPAADVYRAVAARQGLSLSREEVGHRFRAAYRAEEEVDRLSGWVTSEPREVMRWRRIVAETLSGVPDSDACFRELYEHFARPGAWRLEPDAAAVVDALHQRGFALGIGSNYDARLWSVLDGFADLAVLRDRVVISAAIGYRKPGREFFQEVVRVAGCGADEILFVGDDFANDYEGAAAAGLSALLLDPHGRPQEGILVIKSLAELSG